MYQYINLLSVSNLLGEHIEHARKVDDLADKEALQEFRDFLTDPFNPAFGIMHAQTCNDFLRRSKTLELSRDCIFVYQRIEIEIISRISMEK